ncbi:MAG: cytochrome c [Gemmatimonadota bacterium]
MRVLRWAGIVLGSLLALILVALGVLYLLTERRITRAYEVAGREVAVGEDSATIARGEHVAIIRQCTNCHTADLGGAKFIDVPVVARLHTANLTSGQGGMAEHYATSADWERAIRQGVAPDGRALLFMPSHEFYAIGDDDLGALIAYLRSRTPVDRAFAAQSVGPIGRWLFLSGALPLVPAELVDHTAPRPVTPVPSVTVEYGHYLAESCSGCHGATLSGGPIPGAPPEMAAPLNISTDTLTGIGKWTLADFTRAIREGMRPDGVKLGSDMPVAAFAHLSDDEVAAIWMYLRTVPAKAYGGR